MRRAIKGAFLACLILGILFTGFALHAHWKAGQIMDTCQGLLSDDEGQTGQPETIQKLREEFQNPDVLAVLEFPEAGKTFPVVQGVDNTFYLSHNVYGEWDPNGCVFLDTACSPDFTDTANVLYGHNMDDGSMFGWLENYYGEQGIFGKTFLLHLPDGTHTYQILCTTLAEAYGEQVYLSDGLLEKLYPIATQWDGDLPVTDDVKILSLATCYQDGSMYRFGVTGIEISNEGDGSF